MRFFHKIAPWLDTFFVIIIFSFCYYNYYFNISRLSIEGQTENGDAVAVYWRIGTQSYSQKNIRFSYIDTSTHTLPALLPGVGRITALRLDPPPSTTITILKQITFEQPGFTSIVANAGNDFANILPLHEINQMTLQGGRLYVSHDRNDPHVELTLAPQLEMTAFIREIAQGMFALALVLLLLAFLKKIVRAANARASCANLHGADSASAIMVFFFLVMATVILGHVPCGEVLRKDAFAYLVKAVQITHGDWTPLEHGVMGWPIFQAFFLKLFNVSSIFYAMIVSRLLSVILMAAIIIPCYFLCRKILNPYATVVALSGIALSPRFIYMGKDAMTEPLFLLLAVTVVVLLTNDEACSPARMLCAAALAGLSFWVRPNGLFLLPVVFGSVLFAVFRHRKNFSLLFAAPLVFFLVALFQLYDRFRTFGGALHFGANSKYLVSSYQDVWAVNVSAPTWREYILTNSWPDYFHKFVENGLFKVLGYVHRLPGHVWPYLFWVACVFFLVVKKDRKLVPIWLVFTFFILGLVPVADIYGTLRHVYVLLPFLIIIAAKFLGELIARIPARTARFFCTCIFVVFLIMQAGIPGRTALYSPALPMVHDRWAKWAAGHLTGMTAIIEGADLIQMHLSYETLGRMNIDHAPDALSLFRPGNYPHLAAAMKDLDAVQTRYLLLDPLNMRQRPFFNEVYAQEWQGTWRRIKSFRFVHGTPWIIREMDVFERIPVPERN